MKFIVVDQFKGQELVDVYVVDDHKNDFIEIDQQLKLSEAHRKIKEYKEKYGITKADYVLYDNKDVELERKEVTV